MSWGTEYVEGQGKKNKWQRKVGKKGEHTKIYYNRERKK